MLVHIVHTITGGNVWHRLLDPCSCMPCTTASARPPTRSGSSPSERVLAIGSSGIDVRPTTGGKGPMNSSVTAIRGQRRCRACNASLSLAAATASGSGNGTPPGRNGRRRPPGQRPRLEEWSSACSCVSSSRCRSRSAMPTKIPTGVLSARKGINRLPVGSHRP